MELNKNDKLRHNILNIRYIKADYTCGVKYFEDADEEMLLDLLRNNFANKDDYQNCSPTFAEFLAFMKKHEGKFLAGGYITSPERSDYRVTLTTIKEAPSAEIEEDEVFDFIDMFRYADDFRCRDGLYAWYD